MHVANSSGEKHPRWRRYLNWLGPGLVTGAADDDPSGIATYSLAGAAFGYVLLWTVPFELPLMAAIQEIRARIGRITGHGIAGNVRRNYPAWVLYPVIAVLVFTNVINLGADVGAMGEGLRLMIGGPAIVYAIAFAVVSALAQVFITYKRYEPILKWLTLVLLSYVATLFMAQVDWSQALHRTFVPHVQFNGEMLGMITALLGTTISPYLFFWQASQETEEIKSDPKQEPLKKKPWQAPLQLLRIKWDTYAGMFVSQFVAWAIIVTSAATLHAHGQKAETAAEAAQALAPLAGKGASLLFALGIIGTGLLAIPAFAGSAAYAVGEALKWPTGLRRKPLDAKAFYAVVTAATLLGLVIPGFHIDPIRALYWAALINGITAPPIMILIMLMSQNPNITGRRFRILGPVSILGWLATLAMTIAAIGALATMRNGAS